MRADLLRDVGLGAELEQAAGKAGGRLEVTQLEEEVKSGAQHQHHVDGLEVAVGEVGGHLYGKTNAASGNWVARGKQTHKNDTIMSQA